ncbi:MAG: glycoside hydrolase domain-containing protein [Candidatus Korobacteraceae bacterium]
MKFGFILPMALAFALSILATEAAPAQTTYLGMDRNDYPGDTNMQTLRKTFAFTGYWLNNPPGANHNAWQGKRKPLEAMGYGFLLLFNGREYAQLKASGNAARVGATDAVAAVQSAQREGFRKSAILFLDQEQGGRMLPEQRAYIHAWVDGVTRAGYRAGVYCSGIAFKESNAVSIVTANDIRDHAGGLEIHFFVSNDQCPPSPGCVFPNLPPSPSKSGVTFADAWQYAQSPRRPEMTAACRQSYAQDGSCYAPNTPSVYIDVDTANSADPSQARVR